MKPFFIADEGIAHMDVRESNGVKTTVEIRGNIYYVVIVITSIEEIK